MERLMPSPMPTPSRFVEYNARGPFALGSIRPSTLEPPHKCRRFFRPPMCEFSGATIQANSNAAAASLRCKPIFLMRDSKVVGFTPSNSAAPSAPLIFQSGLLQSNEKVFSLASLQPRFGQKFWFGTVADRLRNRRRDLSAGNPMGRSNSGPRRSPKSLPAR